MGGSRSAWGGFFADADFDYEARIVLGAAAAGLGDAGLVLATLNRITDGDARSWFDAWTATAADLAARDDEALRRRHPHTASWAFLAAAEYFCQGAGVRRRDGRPVRAAAYLPRAPPLLGAGGRRVAGPLRPTWTPPR
jgi:hypothetical protein